MSKKKVKKSKPKSDILTGSEIKALAAALIGSDENVFQICQSLFKKKPGCEVFDELKMHEKIFRCENCEMWKGLAEESDNFDWCKECEDEEEPEEEEGWY